MKISKLCIILVSYSAVFNPLYASSRFPTSIMGLPEYICIHEVTTPNFGPRLVTANSNNVSIKTYAYAYISSNMSCPPFISDYAIPANEISDTSEIIWEDQDIIWENIAPIHCDIDLSDYCARFENNMDPNSGCVIPQQCNVVDTDEDCRPGLLPTQ